MASYVKTGLNCVFLALVVVCVLGATDPTSDPEPTTNSTTTPKPPSIHLACTRPHGVMPNWEDDTCRTYLKCTDFLLTVLECEEGQMYSLVKNLCVESSPEECDEQNKAVSLTVEASSYLYAFTNPNYSQGEGGSMPLIDTSTVSEQLRQLTQPGPKRTKRSILQDLGVPAPRDHITNINITLPQAVCERIDHYTLYLEAVMNTVLSMESCPGGACDLPMFELHCEGDYYDGDTNSTDGRIVHTHPFFGGDHHDLHGYYDDDDEDDGVHIEVDDSEDEDVPSGGDADVGLFNFGFNSTVNDVDTGNASDSHGHSDEEIVANTTSLPKA